jgi:hypothetical protein
MSRSAVSENVAVWAADPFTTPGLGGTWMRFWFTPADGRPLAIVRIAAATIGLLLLWTFVGDAIAWFGPAGVLPAESVAAWRGPSGFSILDFASTAGDVRILLAMTAVAFGLLLIGLLTPVAAIAAAVLWASLLNRGPMLAGPADDCLAILLWCVAIGPSGECLSVDRLVRDRRGMPPPAPSWRSRLSLGLIQVHAAAIAIGATLAQLKGDVWWNGTAAWWLAARGDTPFVDLTGAFTRSEFLMNAVTHAIIGFEIAFAAGLWFAASRRHLARIGLVAWPLIGLVAGEPMWGIVMAAFCLPLREDSLESCQNTPAAFHAAQR